MHTSVTVSRPSASSSFACSSRARIRNWCGVTPKSASNCRMKWNGEIPASRAISRKGSASSPNSASIRRARHNLSNSFWSMGFMRSATIIPVVCLTCDLSSEKLAFDLESPKPYELAIGTSPDGMHYQVTLKRPPDRNDMAKWCKTAAFSDDAGVIFLGAANDCKTSAAASCPATKKISLCPHDLFVRATLRRFVRLELRQPISLAIRCGGRWRRRFAWRGGRECSRRGQQWRGGARRLQRR